MCKENYTKKDVFIVKLGKPFSDFQVQIEPTDRFFEGKQYHDLILKDGLSHHSYFGSIPTDDVSEIIDDAKMLAWHAIHDFIEEVFCDYYSPREEDDE